MAIYLVWRIGISIQRTKANGGRPHIAEPRLRWPTIDILTIKKERSTTKAAGYVPIGPPTLWHQVSPGIVRPSLVTVAIFLSQERNASQRGWTSIHLPPERQPGALQHSLCRKERLNILQIGIPPQVQLDPSERARRLQLLVWENLAA